MGMAPLQSPQSRSSGMTPLDKTSSPRILVLNYRQANFSILTEDVINSHHHRNPPVFCAICAGPTVEAKILIGPAEDEPSYLRTKAQNFGFYVRKAWIAEGSQSSHAAKFTFENGRWRHYRELGTGLYSGVYHSNTTSGQPNFPLCQDCFGVLPAFMTHRLQRVSHRANSDITNPEMLYNHLERQFLRDPVTQAQNLRLNWPEHAFAGQIPEWIYDQRHRIWRTPQRWRCESFSQPIPSLPAYVFHKLPQLIESSPIDVSFYKPSSAVFRPIQSSPLLVLPAELLQQITAYLPYYSALSLRRCSQRLSQLIPLDQRFWYTHFLNKELFGFLFAHDSQDVVREIESRALKRGLGLSKYDWINLVRKLARWSSFRDGGCLDDAPAGFRNRRRVWRVLESMEARDEDEAIFT